MVILISIPFSVPGGAMIRSQDQGFQELTTRVFPDKARNLVEEVRSHAMQMRACAPGVPDEQVQRDALAFAAKTLGVPEEEVARRIADWSAGIASDADARDYDKSLALWLKGESDRALTLA